MGREWHWSCAFRKGDKESPGCISTVLHIFDFHQFQYTPQQHQEQQHRQQEQPFHDNPLPLNLPFSKGVEAPRNSLESEGDLFAGNSLSSAISEEDGISIGTPIVTSHSSSLEKDTSSETGSMQGSRTPNLVARLMGLDLLPDQMSSPKIQSQPSSARLKPHPSRKPLRPRETNLAFLDSQLYEMGSRSLPNTPRISSARRSDVDHRLSLQLNKENLDFGDFSYSPFSFKKGRKKEAKFQQQHEENKSPSKYAREIVKQVKESVSRRVGVDITNINANNRFKNSCSSENDALTFNNRKARKPPKCCQEISTRKHTQPSCSPRLRFLDVRNKQKDNTDHLKSSPKSPRLSPSPLSSSSMPRPPPAPLPPSMSSSPNAMSKECTKNKSEPLPRLIVKCKKDSCERFTQLSKKPSASIEKKCKTIPSHATPSFKASHAKKTQAQAAVPLQLSRTSSPSYPPQPAAPLLDDQDDIRTTVTVACGALAAQARYVSEIFQRTGLYRDALVSFAACFTSSYPVHPAVFDQLERCFHDHMCGPLKHRCDRRLFFDLVDEILRDELRPYLCKRPCPMTGEQLVQLLCSRLRRFPLANCQTLDDIDALVEKDMAAAAGDEYLRDEAVEALAVELEREILESLLHEEMVAMV